MVRVLVVDDDEDLLEMITMMLRANRMEVKSLSGGTALFETLSTETPDILLMDIFLGDSDGRELCKQVKKSTAFYRLPVCCIQLVRLLLPPLPIQMQIIFFASLSK